jgi:hypothetical protein
MWRRRGQRWSDALRTFGHRCAISMSALGMSLLVVGAVSFVGGCGVLAARARVRSNSTVTLALGLVLIALAFALFGFAQGAVLMRGT